MDLRQTLLDLSVNSACWIVGTDTGIGKTWVTQQLQSWLHPSSFAMKPVASGSYLVNGEYVNEDALRLHQLQPHYPISLINPELCHQPIAPHLAAAIDKKSLAPDQLESMLKKALNLAHQQRPYQTLLLEGLGGWHVPLTLDYLLSDWVNASQIACVLVVGIKLGCLNHALLTAESLKALDHQRWVGWVANYCETASNDHELAVQDKIVASLQQLLPAPLLGIGGYEQNPGLIVKTSHWQPLIKTSDFLYKTQVSASFR